MEPIPSRFTIAIDTREQHPFCFNRLLADQDQGYAPLIVATEIRTLATGDYSIVGSESQITIERKSIPDLYQTVIKERERFRRELARMSQIPHSFVVVEGDWVAVLRPQPWTKINPKSVGRAIIAFQLEFPLTHWILAPGRRGAEAFTYQTLAMWWRKNLKPRRNKPPSIPASTPQAI